MRSYNVSSRHLVGSARLRAFASVAASICAALLVAVVFAGFASATPIHANLAVDPGDSGQLRDPNSYTIQQIIDAHGIQIGDKLFDGFSVTATFSSNAIAPGAGEIKITPIQIIGSGDYGMIFNGPWSAPAGQFADSTIKFHAVVLTPGYAFKDNELWMTAFGAFVPDPNGNTTANGGISVSENLYAAPPSEHPTSFANKLVWYVNDSNYRLYDQKTFAPIIEMWITKDVVAYGGAGNTGYVHLSEFYQTFSQVPEPGTFVLLGIGGLGLAGYVWRKRRG